MAHTYTSLLFHCVFSTKEREKLLTPQIRERLFPYLGGIARENEIKAMAVGGTGDHVHMLLSAPAKLSIAKSLQLIKGGSSKWISETFNVMRNFQWQKGYGAFTLSISHVADTIAYIKGQEEHHRNKTFQEEYVEFLKRHGIEYDERYIWK
ncbi:IS200/IS605 family transposase [Candidatus Hydrogenedentota bacterium]